MEKIEKIKILQSGRRMLLGTKSFRQIHVPTTEIPRPKMAVGRTRKWHPQDRLGHCTPPRRGERAGCVARGAAITSPKNPRPTAMAAVLLRRPETRRVLAKTPLDRPSMGSESPHAAKERPSCGNHPGTPSVPTRRMGDEAASWEQSPRPSAGRPRKASR